MITKIFFTMLVIIIVGMIFRTQNQAAQPAKKEPATAPDNASLAPKTVAYMLVGLLIMVSGVVYYFSWSDANTLVRLRVTNAGGVLSEYQAYRKDIKGREFTSIDGMQIQLADSDRLEMLIENQTR